MNDLFSAERILEHFGHNRIPSADKNKKRKLSTETADTEDWDIETRAVLALLRELPPATRGRDRETRGAISNICDKLIVFSKVS